MIKSKSRQRHYGKLITNNVILLPHEQYTINFLLNLGHDIELIRPSFTPKSKSPDFIMNGLAWEMKCPKGTSKTSFITMYRRATHQSTNVIMDLRHTHIRETEAITLLHNLFKSSKHAKHLWIITKKLKLIQL